MSAAQLPVISVGNKCSLKPLMCSYMFQRAVKNLTFTQSVYHVHFTCSWPDFYTGRWRWCFGSCQASDCSSPLCFNICKSETDGYFWPRHNGVTTPVNLSSVDLLKETLRQFPVVFVEIKKNSDFRQEVRTSPAVLVTKTCLLHSYLLTTLWLWSGDIRTRTTWLGSGKKLNLLHEMYIFNMVCRNAHYSFILLQVYYDSLL